MVVGLPRGSVLPDHARGWTQLVFATEGVGRVVVDGAAWVLPPSGALWVPAGIRHELRCVTHLALCTLYFEPDAEPRLAAKCQVLQVSLLLAALIEAVAAGVNDPGDRQRRRVAVLHDELEAAPISGLRLPLPSDPRARRPADRLTNRPDPGASLDELCARAGGSRRTLERRFREETGVSLGAWRSLARLHRSALLLGEGHTVAEVAEQVGYRSPSAFVHAFRQRFGVTPGRLFSR